MENAGSSFRVQRIEYTERVAGCEMRGSWKTSSFFIVHSSLLITHRPSSIVNRPSTSIIDRKRLLRQISGLVIDHHLQKMPGIGAVAKGVGDGIVLGIVFKQFPRSVYEAKDFLAVDV